ncbi:hypothetical protein QYM18_05965 [Ectopseudomonas chengduensis]|jgi:hypothetical protein|nr:hypothetical protein [Pseudomonas chengduensis]WKC38633.1 hypothetical protein QYM18_05965 [Pseudomonas chengduensis]
MHIQEATLRTLAATGAVRELVAQRVRSGDIWVWVLLVRAGANEFPLERQRGGAREFKTLDAVAALVDSLGESELTVKLNA